MILTESCTMCKRVIPPNAPYFMGNIYGNMNVNSILYGKCFFYCESCFKKIDGMDDVEAPHV